MLIHLDPSLPLQKSADITKHLRSRDVPITSLLPFAISVLDERKPKERNLYFPQKEEWLLEWLVQRLREDDGGSPGARCDPEFWKFLLHLLPHSASAGGILKKHNFLQLISKTFSEAALLPVATLVVGQDGDTRMEDEEVYNTPKERPSPSLSNSMGQAPTAAQTPSKLRDLLESISVVLLYLQENMRAGRGEGNVVAVLRGAPEVGAQILGSYLKVCQVLVRSGVRLEEEWTNVVEGIWRNCVWGNPNLKKLSMIFSTCCLVPATQLLEKPFTPPDLRNRLEQLIAEFIFSHETLFPLVSGSKSLNPSSKELKPLLESLRVQKKGLPHIFKIAIASQTRKRKPDSDTVEAIFESIISAILEITFPVDVVTDSDAGVIMGLLTALADTGTTVSSDMLAELVDGVSNISHSDTYPVRWDVVEVALKLDFNIFLGKENKLRALKLIETLTKNSQKEGSICKIIELLIDGFVKARDLVGFVEAWVSELHKGGAQGGIWEDDMIARLFSERMEKALLPGQIEKIFRVATREGTWVIIDAVLRGVKREDTEDKIRGLLGGISEAALESKSGWREWRALMRGLQIENGLMEGKQGEVLKHLKKLVGGGTGGDARKMLFVGEVLVDSADIEGQTEVLNVVIRAMRSVTKGWNGSVEDIDQENLGVALIMGFVSRWMGVVERVPPEVREGFVDEFLNMAIKNIIADGNRKITGRSAWQGMLTRGISYEYPALKDAVIAALIAKLEPFSNLSQGVSTSLEDIEKCQGTSINQSGMDYYEFLLESIAKYPLEAVKRATREKILDALVLLGAALEKRNLDGVVREEVGRLIERLWVLGNGSSLLARDASGFMTWYLGGGGGGEAGRRILRYVLATKEQKRSHEFLTKLVGLAESEFLCVGKPKINVVKVCQIIIEEFYRGGEGSSVQQLRRKILEQLRKSMETGEANGDFVGAWRRIWVLDWDSSDTEEGLELAQNIIEGIKTKIPRVLIVTEHVGNVPQAKEAAKTIAETSMLFCDCSKTAEEAVKTTALVIGILDSPYTQSYRPEIIITYSRMVSDRLDPEVYLECLERVSRGCFLFNDDIVGPGCWEALKILINGAKKPEEGRSTKLTGYLSILFSMLARNLPRAKTAAELLAVADCMDVILREKAWAIMQYNIDETLTSVAIASSPSGPQLSPTTNADEIFHRLCNLARLVLSLHRRRVRGGRYHLVIATLQSLLHCIYKHKPIGERKKSDKIFHPPWLLPPTQSYSRNPIDMPGITGRCADSFNRLLITFCEPSVSSVRNRGRKIDANLVHSVRDREKREVSICVGSLLGEILKGSLEGGFDGDITVSVSAIFEVLGAEGVKGFAKTIDREGRAMLREFWDEYNRVGGGAGEKL